MAWWPRTVNLALKTQKCARLERHTCMSRRGQPRRRLTRYILAVFTIVLTIVLIDNESPSFLDFIWRRHVTNSIF